jgi:hypothetical protein
MLLILLEICLCRCAEVDTFFHSFRACKHATYLPELFHPLLCTFSEITSHNRHRRPSFERCDGVLLPYALDRTTHHFVHRESGTGKRVCHQRGRRDGGTVRRNEAVTSQCVQLQYFPTRSDHKLHRDRRAQTHQPASPCNIATTSVSV